MGLISRVSSRTYRWFPHHLVTPVSNLLSNHLPATPPLHRLLPLQKMPAMKTHQLQSRILIQHRLCPKRHSTWLQPHAFLTNNFKRNLDVGISYRLKDIQIKESLV